MIQEDHGGENDKNVLYEERMNHKNKPMGKRITMDAQIEKLNKKEIINEVFFSHGKMVNPKNAIRDGQI
jgi:hypothetical protein